MIRNPLLVPLLVATGVLAGLIETRWQPARERTGLTPAVAFGAGFVLAREAFRSAWVGFPLIGLGSSKVGSWSRWQSTLMAVGGVALALLAMAGEVAPNVTVPGFIVLVLVAFQSRPETGRRLGLLVASSLAVSQFGLYAALPDTESAVAAGGVALGLAIASLVFGNEASTLTAVSVILLAVMLGSARDTETLLGALPALGLFAALAVPRAGQRLEDLLTESLWLQSAALVVHLALCGLPRWLIVGYV